MSIASWSYPFALFRFVPFLPDPSFAGEDSLIVRLDPESEGGCSTSPFPKPVIRSSVRSVIVWSKIPRNL